MGATEEILSPGRSAVKEIGGTNFRISFVPLSVCCEVEYQDKSACLLGPHSESELGGYEYRVASCKPSIIPFTILRDDLFY